MSGAESVSGVNGATVAADRLGHDPAETSAGAALLDELVKAARFYTVFPTNQAADAVALWIATTYAVCAFDTAPRLHFTGPEKRCGKSRALDIVEATCHRPLITVNASVAAVFRSIGDDPPTLIMDEVDTVFGTAGKKANDAHEDLRGLLNAGFQRNRPVLRCVGPNQTVTEFPSFAMAAFAGIGDLPDTVADRSVVIRMRRKAPGESAAPYRVSRDRAHLRALGDQVGAWVGNVVPTLRGANPVMPVEDRAADLWEPLIAVADVAGGTWPGRARDAAEMLTRQGEEAGIEASVGVRLLSDCRDVLAKGPAEIASEDLVARLRAIPDAPWEGFEFTSRNLASRLSAYGIRPGLIRPDPEDRRQVRGYKAADFLDSFARYLPRPSAPAGDA